MPRLTRTAWRAIVVSLGIVVGAAPTRAQRATADTGIVGIGQRVRLRTTAERGWYVGQLVQAGPDTVRLEGCTSCAPVVIPRERMRGLERSAGRRPTLWPLTAMLGAAAGMVIGVRLVGRYDHCHGEYCQLGDALLAGLFGAVTGGEIGTAVGDWLDRERWHPARLPRSGEAR